MGQRNALGIGKENLGARISQPVFQFIALPPSIERNNDGTNGGGRPEHNRPLGVVAHAQRHPVTFLHPKLVDEQTGHRHHFAEVLLVGHPLVLEDDVVTIKEISGVFQNMAQRGRRRLPHISGNTVNVEGLNVEHSASGGDEFAVRFFNREGHRTTTLLLYANGPTYSLALQKQSSD